MFSEAPELYDALYGSFKDYDGESERVARLLARVAPDARRVLDVGCGTGEHALRLHQRFGFDVDGLDLEPAFVDIARGKLPAARFAVADMADFHLGDRYDALLCLFSSIGYLTRIEQVESAARCFREHLVPGGIAVIEPWLTPDRWTPGRVYVHTAEAEGRQVVRMSHSTVEGRVSRLEFQYLIGSADGIVHKTEHHALGLFTTAELIAALERAGFASVEHDPEGLTGRGLLIARASA